MLKKYEIDFLKVGAADAILIHFITEKDKECVVSIDAGRYSDGDKVINFVKNRYHRKKIDVAICTHCDDDHFGGYIKIIEEFQKGDDKGLEIGCLWMNDPGKFVDASDFKRRSSTEIVKEEEREVYTLKGGDKNLLEFAKSANIRIEDAFFFFLKYNRAFGGKILLLGPTKKYYCELAKHFNEKLEPYDTTIDAEDDTSLVEGRCLSPKLDMIGDDGSSHNQSSVIVLFGPGDGRKFVFMGDAGYAAFANMREVDRNKMQNAFLLKVPHHGSKYNMNSEMINFINPQAAIVSAESEENHFSPLVKNALKRKGTKVYCTMSGGNLLYNRGFDKREGYKPAVPL